MTRITSFTIFEPKIDGNGAEKRTAQIVEILKKSGYTWSKIPTGIWQEGSVRNIWKNLPVVIYYYIKTSIQIHRWPSMKRILKNTWLYSHFQGIMRIKSAEGPRVMLMESSKLEFSFVIQRFRSKGYHIVALPHNLESLVPGQKSGITNRFSPDWFSEEISLLRKCGHVFAISSEETLLLRQFRIRADYLPYYPCDETFAQLLRIREHRQTSRIRKKGKKSILLLGSVVNIPTRNGILNRMEYFRDLKAPDLELLVAGYGTNKFPKDPIPKNEHIRIIGELSNEQMTEVLEEVDTVLIHQEASSGALTRIPENLIAGIPVVANFDSGKNYFGSDGLHIYHSDAEMLDLLRIDLPVPEIPEKPVAMYERFISTLNQYHEK